MRPQCCWVSLPGLGVLVEPRSGPGVLCPRRTRITPMRVGIAMVALDLCAQRHADWFLREAGLAWATSTAAMVQTIILMF